MKSVVKSSQMKSVVKSSQRSKVVKCSQSSGHMQFGAIYIVVMTMNVAVHNTALVISHFG